MSAPAPLKHLHAGWFAVVMGLAGLSLAWHAAVPVMGDAADRVFAGLGMLAAAVAAVLAAAAAWRALRHADAWADDLRHPVRHASLATLPVSGLLLVTVALVAFEPSAPLRAAWALSASAQWAVTVWVLARWWRGAPAGLAWGGLTPGLLVPVVGNVLVPLAGVPLGFTAWSAAQMGIGMFFWPVLVALLLARLAQQGPWPERLLPGTVIFLAPPSVIGLSLAQFGAPAGVLWALWGLAAFTLMWLVPLARRIAAQPFGVIHWSVGFPLAAFAGLTLRLWPAVWPGVVLLAATSVVMLGLAVATLRGLRDGRLLAPESVPIAPAP